MIHAVITKKGSVPLDVEFPCDIEQIKEQLAERSIPPNLQGIRLTNEENAEIGVKLSSDNDIGKRLIPLFSSNDSLADLESVTFGVESIPTDFKDELEKNIMSDVYGFASELTADMKVMRYSAEYRNLSDSDLSSEQDKTSQELFALSDNELEQVDYDARHKALWLEMDRRKQKAEQHQDKKPDDPYERITVVGGEMSPQEQLAYLGMMKEKHPDWDILSMKLTIVDDNFVDIECEHKGTPFERIRRITGYLVGDIDRFNNAKKAEVQDRVKHTFDTQDFEDVYTDEETPAMKIGGI